MHLNYQLKYECHGTVRRISSQKRLLYRLAWICGAVLLLMILIWSSGGDGEVTRQALENMASSIGQGADVREAFSAFCLEILQGA